MRSNWRQNYYDSGWGIPLLPAVKWILVVNLGLFFLNVIFSQIFKTPIVGNLLQLSSEAVRHGYIWQFMTYMFFHYDFMHIAINLLLFYFFGNEVEAELGPKRLTQIYLLGGLAGGLLWFVFNLNHSASVVGASGAVYSVLIAFATLYPERPLTLLLFFVWPVTILAKNLAYIVVALSVVLSILSNDGIAHLAHLGGIVVGYLYIKTLHNGSWLPQLKLIPKKSYPKSSKIRILPFPEKKDFMKEQIDPILDKIAKHGIQSLTSEERKLLDEAKDRLP
jgi:membrane associated rhomboid family serine protease